MISTIRLVAAGVVAAVVNFLAQPAIFPPPPQLQQLLSGSGLFPDFIFLPIWDAVAFAFGVAFLLHVVSDYRKWGEAVRRPLLPILFVALSFSALNWVHNGLHITTASSWLQERVALEAGVHAIRYLAVDYSFRVPWLVFAMLLFISIRRIVPTLPAQKSTGGQL